jgi:hypothetical protein
MYQKHTREIKKTKKEREKEGGRLDGVLGWQVELANLEEKRREESACVWGDYKRFFLIKGDDEGRNITNYPKYRAKRLKNCVRRFNNVGFCLSGC